MKTKIIVLAVVILGAVSLVSAQKTMKTNPLEKTLTDKETMAWKNLVDKKFDDFSKIFADDYQGVYDFEVTTKASELAEVKQITFRKADVSNVKVAFPAANTAIVTATVKRDFTTSDGKNMMDNIRTTSVWVKRGAQWLTVYHSEVTIKE